MKKSIISLTLISLITIHASCASILKPLLQAMYLPVLDIEVATSEINYDSIYYSMDYYLTKHMWPITKDDLSNYAITKNHHIDFDKYKYFAIEQCSPKRINIHFVIKNVNSTARTFNDIKGIIGIFIEDESKVNIEKYEDKKIVLSFTVGKNPYNDQNSNVSDGYSVHNYIEFSYPPFEKITTINVNKGPFINIQKIKNK
jgi:hypothetical protein